MPGFDGGCVFSCRHNVWGGNGTCMSIQEADSIEYECSCGDGYVSKDSFGLPSCVWKLALVGLYTAVRGNSRRCGGMRRSEGPHECSLDRCYVRVYMDEICLRVQGGRQDSVSPSQYQRLVQTILFKETIDPGTGRLDYT